MSHNVHSEQPSKRRRRCPCPHPGHLHGCENRYNNGPRCRCHHCTTDHMRRAKHRKTSSFANRRIPSIGTARRLQALAVNGWSSRMLAARLGIGHDALDGWRRSEYATVYASTAKRIADLYSELWDQPPPADSPESITKVRANAARRGWVPPLAWDNIDDPHDHPHGMTTDEPADVFDPVRVERLLSGWQVDATPTEIDAAAIRLIDLGEAVRGVARHLRISAPRVQRAQARARARLEVAA